MNKKALILDDHLDDSDQIIIVTVYAALESVKLESQDPDIPFTMYLWKEDLEAILELLDD